MSTGSLNGTCFGKRFFNGKFTLYLLESVGSSNRLWNIEFIERLGAANIDVNRIDMPGDHGAGHADRFQLLVEHVSTALEIAQPVIAVSPQGKLTTMLGAIKRCK